jgi:hypothetical protein
MVGQFQLPRLLSRVEFMSIEQTKLVENNRVKRTSFFLLIVISAAFSLFINLKMPLVGEDYTLQAWGYNAVPSSFFERINIISHRVYNSAIMWSPRIGEALATITSVFPKIIFDAINVILFIWLIMVLFVLVYGRFPNSNNYPDVFTLFSIVFLVFTLFPLLGQVFFWKAGVSNHLWGVILILSFMLPFRLNSAKKIKINSIQSLLLYTLLGFFAGLTIENVSAVVLGFLLFYYLISYRNKLIDIKFIYPLMANAVGVSLLLFSPGTTYRRIYYSQFGYDGNYTGIAMFINRFGRVHTDFMKTTWPLLVTFFVCLLIFTIAVLWNKKFTGEQVSKKTKSSLIALLIMFVMAYLSVLIMITISYQSDQRRGFTFFWLIVISQIAYLMTEILKKLPNRMSLAIFSILAIIFMAQMLKIATVYTRFNQANAARMEIIHSALTAGQNEVVLPAISTPDSRVLETREILSDLGVRIATYYGLEIVEIQK